MKPCHIIFIKQPTARPTYLCIPAAKNRSHSSQDSFAIVGPPVM